MNPIQACIAGALVACCASAQSASDSPSWRKLEFLLGNWVGIAGETPAELGSGQGPFSFEAELNRNIIVRRNRAEYSSGVRHDDLMVIYFNSADNTPRAIYFDTEGHVIHYDVKFPSPNSAVFESPKGEPGPRYRLSYRLESASLNGKFEIAEPGAEFKTYLSWTSRRSR
jgi:hypothetical protein